MGADKQTQAEDLYLYRSLELILRYLFQTVDELTNPMDRVWAPVKSVLYPSFLNGRMRY